MCWMLTVEMTSMPASRMLLDVLPALRVRRAGCVGVGELVDERDVGMAGEDRVDVEFVEGHAAVLDRAARDDLEPSTSDAVAARPWVSTMATTTSRPVAEKAPALLEHREGLADAGRGSEHHPQPATCHGSQSPSSASAMFSSSTLTVGSPR